MPFWWLTGFRDREALELVEAHSEAVRGVVSSLASAMEAFFKGDRKGFNEKKNDIMELEDKADYLRKKAFASLRKTTLMPTEREDLFRLVGEHDIVADYTKEASRTLDLIKDFPQDFKQDFLKIGFLIEDAEIRLDREIRGIGRKKPDVESIERIEEEIDDLEYKIKKRMLKKGIYHNSLLKDLLKYLEETADTIEDTSEIIILVGIRRL